MVNIIISIAQMKVQEKQSHWIIIHVDNSIVVLVLISLLSFVVPFAGCDQPRNAPSPPPHDGSVMENKADPGLTILFVCLIMAFFMMGCASVYGRQCIESRMGFRLTSIDDQANQATQEPQRLAASGGHDAAVIGAFPTFLYSDVKGHKTDNVALECTVCLNEFEHGETLRLLPKCCHVFHLHCIGTWLASHVTCPVCGANLILVPGQERESNDVLLGCDSVSESTKTTRLTEVLNQLHEHEISELAIDLHSSPPEMINLSRTVYQKRPVQSTLKSPEDYEKFSRSHSTGHSLIQPGDDFERFTLRLPEDVQKKLMQPELRRANSNVAFPSARSSKKGYRSNSVGTGGERNYHHTYYEGFDQEGRPDRWGFTMTPPFISWTGSTSSQKEPDSGNNLTVRGSVFKSVTSPFDRLFRPTEKDDVGERSFARLAENNLV